jgi:hypothetical protein
MGHSRRGRAASKYGHARCAAESGSKFRVLAARDERGSNSKTGASNREIVGLLAGERRAPFRRFVFGDR